MAVTLVNTSHAVTGSTPANLATALTTFYATLSAEGQPAFTIRSVSYAIAVDAEDVTTYIAWVDYTTQTGSI